MTEKESFITLTPGACIIKLFFFLFLSPYLYLSISLCTIRLMTAVIYGFRNKLECLSLNTRLGWESLPGTNTLPYYRNCKS
jgi:hypothetical protein